MPPVARATTPNTMRRMPISFIFAPSGKPNANGTPAPLSRHPEFRYYSSEVNCGWLIAREVPDVFQLPNDAPAWLGFSARERRRRAGSGRRLGRLGNDEARDPGTAG